MLLRVYAVKDKGTEQEQRLWIADAETTAEARSLIRDAIACGFDYGYAKEGTDTVLHLTEKSFL